jgi:hypothetical protein
MVTHTGYRGILILAFCMGASAQSLSIPQSTGKRGGSGSFLLKLESAPGKAPVALQWKFIFPPNVRVDIADILAASAAESAQKSLTCSFLNDPKQRPGCACILAGGKQSIPNGTLAAVRYHIGTNAPVGPDKIRVESALAVMQDLTKVELPNVESLIVVQ